MGDIKLVNLTKGEEHARVHKARKDLSVVDTSELLILKDTDKLEYSDQNLRLYTHFIKKRKPVINDISIKTYFYAYSNDSTIDYHLCIAPILRAKNFVDIEKYVKYSMDTIINNARIRYFSKFINITLYTEDNNILIAAIMKYIETYKNIKNFKLIVLDDEGVSQYSIIDKTTNNNTNNKLRIYRCNQLYTYGFYAQNIFDSLYRYQLIENFKDNQKNITIINSKHRALNIYNAFKQLNRNVNLNVLECKDNRITTIDTL